MNHGPLTALAILLLTNSPPAPAQIYPLRPSDNCGETDSCEDVLDAWNVAGWDDIVDHEFNTGPTALAAVRWYCTEGDCTGSGQCNEQLNNGEGCCTFNDPKGECPNPDLDTDASRFWGVTDELSNVLLSHAMGRDQSKYQKLHNFVELLRHPSINGLQCWQYFVDGVGLYDDFSDLCQETDSASDASLRILHAYAIACAKQTAGEWDNDGVDFCADYLEQGNAIWGLGTASHGEIKLLANGEYFLGNGYNNQPGSPQVTDSFRPDYYELQALMDFARFIDNEALQQGVIDMLRDYSNSLGDNHIHCGKTGHFDADTVVYTCDQLCTPPYMDNTDTWRAVPALSGLLLTHAEAIPLDLKATIFDYWWGNYSGGHPTLYGPTDSKPFQIFCNSADGVILSAEENYKTLGMWIPLSVRYDSIYALQAVSHLVDLKYDSQNSHFFAAAYYGGYFSQFAQRAIGTVTGLIDPVFWSAPIFSDGFETGDTSAWSEVTP